MELTNLATELGAIVRKQLVWVYVCWIAATGIALTFVIVPGYQTLAKFEQTECTTVKVLKSGVNPCTYCLQVFVVTKEKTEARPLRHDELADETRVRFMQVMKFVKDYEAKLFPGFDGV